MGFTKNDIEKSIEVLENPSKYIHCAHKTENGMDFMYYHSDFVKALEVAIESMMIRLKE